MRKKSFLVALSIFLAAGSAFASGEGEALFDKHCATCHPDGGNIIKPEKTLNQADLQANDLTTVDNLVQQMRDPGPGMPKFGEETIPDDQAKQIAEYILQEFK